MPSSDLELVRRVLDGDPSAADAVVARLGGIPLTLARLDRRWGGVLGSEDLRDLAQDCFLAVWTRLSRYTGEASLATWSHAFCVNGFRNAVRRKTREQERGLALPASLPLAPGAEPGLERVQRSLARIRPDDARVVRLRCFGDLAFEEIGAGLGISPNTAKTCYYRGLRRLAELLGDAPGHG